MIIKITENNMKDLENAMVDAARFTDYNSDCFSCSDIRRAEAVCNEFIRVFEILKDNNIDVSKYFSPVNIEAFSEFYNNSKSNKIENPKHFEILIPIDALWRFSKELTKHKYSEDTFVKISNDYFCKYWTDISINSLYDIKPTMEALNAFAEINGKLDNALDIIKSELNNCNIDRIRAVDCGNDGMELKICYSKENIERILFMYEDRERADILITENEMPIKIYPLDIENKISLFFENQSFSNEYERLLLERDRLNNLSEQIWTEKLEEIELNNEAFSNADVGSVEKDIYDYVHTVKSISKLEKDLKQLEDKDSEFFKDFKKCEDGTINPYLSDYTDEEMKIFIIDSINEEIYNMSENISNAKFDITSKIYNNLSTEDFRKELEKIYRQKRLLLSKDMKVDFSTTNTLDNDFENAEKYCNVKFN